jgi:phenylacetate-CoA ligase
MELGTHGRLAKHILNGVPLFFKMNFGNYKRVASRRLRFLVKYAYENVELYRRKYDAAGIKPEDIRGIDDLTRLPLITKKDLVDGYPDDIISKGLRQKDYYVASTSGSTGMPVRIFKDRSLLSAGIFSSLFLHKLAGFYLGLNLGNKLMSIFVNTPDSLEGVSTAEKMEMPAFYINRNPHLDALDGPQKHIEGLNTYKPDLVFTYPSVLRNMAVYSQQQNIVVHQPKLMLVSGELMDKNTRQVIGRVFKGELLNFYIATECGTVATECGNHKGMHLRATSVILELLKDGKPVPPGMPGEVVVTDLWNQATPIIRYAGLKDIAAISPDTCNCRQKTPLLKVVEGRLSDSITLRDGRVLHPFSLTLALEHVPGIARFQIIQESQDQIKVLLVGENGCDRECAQNVEDNLKKVLGDGVNIDIEFVKDIPRRHDGQSHRVVISRIS